MISQRQWWLSLIVVVMDQPVSGVQVSIMKHRQLLVLGGGGTNKLSKLNRKLVVPSLVLLSSPVEDGRSSATLKGLPARTLPSRLLSDWGRSPTQGSMQSIVGFRPSSAVQRPTDSRPTRWACSAVQTRSQTCVRSIISAHLWRTVTTKAHTTAYPEKISPSGLSYSRS